MCNALQVYQRMLCKRLIYKLSASMDAEEAMINRLKVCALTVACLVSKSLVLSVVDTCPLYFIYLVDSLR